MPESIEELQNRLRTAVSSGFRGRLLDRGLARSLIWQEGKLPAGAPPFSASLTEDLLDYAYTIMTMALRLREISTESAPLEQAFFVAGEAIEAAVYKGERTPERGFHRVNAAVAFHLARYAALAYSVLPTSENTENLSPTEKSLTYLLRRKLDALHTSFSTWLLNSEHGDSYIVDQLKEDDDFDEMDAANIVLTTSFMRGLALFDHAIRTGQEGSAADAKLQLRITADAASDLHMVNHWWTSTLASHLTDELWQLSLYSQIPGLPTNDADYERWRDMRRNYIQLLHARKRATIELWPSQLEAVQRAIDVRDDLVIALPTSSGKTRIAELCMLRTLAAGKRVIYITPLRALSAQVERDLAEIFMPLGFSVSSLYGAAGVESGDFETLRDRKIIVATPEKLDFALRNDPSILNDIGLVVLDEGHMLGPSEREVRYEALVQRLLKRGDADSRRIVCLSALFPTPEEMRDFVAWIRQDETGRPVYSKWRPTRQRFGVLQWHSGKARLDIAVEEESPFVPSFVEAREPPSGSRRKRVFPHDKSELTLAAAWRFVEQEKQVLVYCALRSSVEKLGRLVLKCIEHKVLIPLREMNPDIENAMNTGAEWLGVDHPAVQCLQYGVALHHAGLPRPFLNEIEQLLRSGDCPLTIASPTLAQGLNLSASVLIVPSIWRNRAIIPASEFANVAGRAGRAFVDVEGLIIHIIWEESAKNARWALRNWEHLVAEAKGPRIVSGILELAMRLFHRLAQTSDVPLDELVDYVTGHGDVWDFNQNYADKEGITAVEWENDLASFDSAILALIDADTSASNLESALDNMLEGSLFSRQLADEIEAIQGLLRRFVAARTEWIWSQTLEVQRKGYHVAGIGLRSGQFLDENLTSLVNLLRNIELSIARGDTPAATSLIINFAELIFQTTPFRPRGELPDEWENALHAWMAGRPGAEVIGICRTNGVYFLQDALTYRLPWAMEAVRVHASAVEHEGVEELNGLVALAVEAGSTNLSVITLLRNGLRSREAAIEAVASTDASFDDRAGLLVWLNSDDIRERTTEGDWPTERSRHAWLQFYERERNGFRRKWNREVQRIDVDWLKGPPKVGASVVAAPDQGGTQILVLSPDFTKLGILMSPLGKSYRQIVGAIVEETETVKIEYFGPPD